MSNNGSVIHRYVDAAEEPTEMLPPIEGYEKKPLVSLEEAVRDLKSLVNDLERKVWVVNRKASKPADALTSDEAAAILLYTMEWSDANESLYIKLNQMLRSEIRNHLKPWFSYLKLLLTALYKLPSIKDTVWRGVRGNVSEQYQKDCIWWGFSSCTETMEVLERFIGREGLRTIFMVECINGKRIQNHSFYENENEILLTPGTYLHVVDKWSPSEGLHMVRLRETTPPHPLIASPIDSSASITKILSSGEVCLLYGTKFRIQVATKRLNMHPYTFFLIIISLKLF